MRVTLTNIIKEILESNGEKLSVELNEGTQFKEIGLTSFDLAVLTVEIENIYGQVYKYNGQVKLLR